MERLLRLDRAAGLSNHAARLAVLVADHDACIAVFTFIAGDKCFSAEIASAASRAILLERWESFY